MSQLNEKISAAAILLIYKMIKKRHQYGKCFYQAFL